MSIEASCSALGNECGSDVPAAAPAEMWVPCQISVMQDACKPFNSFAVHMPAVAAAMQLGTGLAVCNSSANHWSGWTTAMQGNSRSSGNRKHGTATCYSGARALHGSAPMPPQSMIISHMALFGHMQNMPMPQGQNLTDWAMVAPAIETLLVCVCSPVKLPATVHSLSRHIPSHNASKGEAA